MENAEKDTRAEGTNRLSSPEDHYVIQVVEEKVVVEKEIVETGKVRVRKTVHEETATINIPIYNQSYQIERKAVPQKTLDAPPPALRHEGDTMIIPVVREITIVQKRYEVLEEIHIKKIVTETPLTQEITLLREQVEIKRDSNI
jgi:uncharacterized protein (TIGR02271 family)